MTTETTTTRLETEDGRHAEKMRRAAEFNAQQEDVPKVLTVTTERVQ